MRKRLSKSTKRPTDVNQLAHHLVNLSTSAVADEKPEPRGSKVSRSEISRVMSAMGRKGGKKSAKARMEKIPPEQRSEIALKAAQARWQKKATSELFSK